MLSSPATRDGDMASRHSRVDHILSVVENSLQAGLVPGKAAILVACSGGADSTLLLDVMRVLQQKNDWSIAAVYVNHHQFGGSEKIEKNLRTKCSRWKIPFWALSVDTDRVPRGSSEATMRDERYALLSEFARQKGFDRIALAHTASDQVETILMRILRGTSTRGLTGIPWIRDGIFIRPMLQLTREEIVEYLKVRRLRWFEDPTNQDRAFLRNYIRHELLPLLRRRINPAVDNALLRLSESAAMDQVALSKLASEVRITTERNYLAKVDFDELVELPDAVRAWVLIYMLRSLEGNGANLEQRHVLELLEKLRENKTFRLELQGRLEAYFNKKNLLVQRKRIDLEPFSLQVDGPGEFVLPANLGKVIVRIREEWDPSLANAHHVFFDAKSLSFPFFLRSVKKGDRISPWGMRGSKKVVRLLRDQGIWKEHKKMIVVMQVNDEIFWILGVRRSRMAKVTKNAKKVMEIVFVSNSAA